MYKRRAAKWIAIAIRLRANKYKAMRNIYISPDGQCVRVWNEVIQRIACYHNRDRRALTWI